MRTEKLISASAPMTKLWCSALERPTLAHVVLARHEAGVLAAGGLGRAPDLCVRHVEIQRVAVRLGHMKRSVGIDLDRVSFRVLEDRPGIALVERAQRRCPVINGRTERSSNTRHLIFKVPAIVSYGSAIFDLVPGDVLVTGTPASVGWSRKPPAVPQGRRRGRAGDREDRGAAQPSRRRVATRRTDCGAPSGYRRPASVRTVAQHPRHFREAAAGRSVPMPHSGRTAAVKVLSSSPPQRIGPTGS